jgi:cytochrome c oxidase subunit 2
MSSVDSCGGAASKFTGSHRFGCLLLLQAGIPLRPELASQGGAQFDALFLTLVGLSLLLCIGIFGTILYFAIRYRRRNDGRIPPDIRKSIPLEVTWTVIPLLINLVIFFWAAHQFFNNAEPPVGATEIFVVGKQWMWHLQHPEGPREINELHIPVNVPVKLVMTSQDVIHDFFVPAFRTKQDVVPGRYTMEWFLPNKVGRYHLFCAQYCGMSHSGMTGWVYVMQPEDYAAWLQRNRSSESAGQVGQRLFAKLACSNCHQADHSGSGPPLNGVYGSVVTLQNGEKREVDESFLRQIVLDPSSVPLAGYSQTMPSFRGEITEEELLELIAYLKFMNQQPVAQIQPPGVNP